MHTSIASNVTEADTDMLQCLMKVSLMQEISVTCIQPVQVIPQELGALAFLGLHLQCLSHAGSLLLEALQLNLKP
jgi:hypothetical protein